ncbi:hypothetical protein DV515_00019033 [Chloebia gouldiae]|uniref:G-protein coupled receptors family 1 profile domain-containing protein n=1 Tax=Chloebia gouldiae TaxID=44316 RepID=A0A3L8Q5V6_CHLGU|nr:hypothetical protein DV515_00019033 [Chloebia gouldiae]
MVVLMVTCCFFPLAVIIFCYLQVWLAIRAVRRPPQKNPDPKKPRGKNPELKKNPGEKILN